MTMHQLQPAERRCLLLCLAGTAALVGAASFMVYNGFESDRLGTSGQIGFPESFFYTVGSCLLAVSGWRLSKVSEHQFLRSLGLMGSVTAMLVLLPFAAVMIGAAVS